MNKLLTFEEWWRSVGNKTGWPPKETCELIWNMVARLKKEHSTISFDKFLIISEYTKITKASWENN